MKTKISLLILIILAALGIAVATTDLKAIVMDRLGMASTDEPTEGEHEGGEGHGEHEEHAKHKIITTTAVAKDVTITEKFVCQIHSRRHIELKSLEDGYLEAIAIKEGQTVQKGDVLFSILPTMFNAKLEADIAEADLARVEYINTKKLVQQGVVSDQELKMAKARVSKALAKVQTSKAELDFTKIKAPFDGIIDRLMEQEGSFIEQGAMLTTMSDNSVMWVYYNVPEAKYLEFQAATRHGRAIDSLDFRLQLANHEIFSEAGKFGTIEAEFNNETGNIKFRTDFPNPDRMLRHGQTGSVLVSQTLKDAIVIPQRATYEILADRFVFVVGDDSVVKQRKIKILHENEDIFVIESGLEAGEEIIFEGIRQVHDGETIQREKRPPEELLNDLKFHAE